MFYFTIHKLQSSGSYLLLLNPLTTGFSPYVPFNLQLWCREWCLLTNISLVCWRTVCGVSVMRVWSATHWSLYGHCSSSLQVLYKDASTKGTPVTFTPEMERVRRNQEHISSVLSQEPCALKFMSKVTDLTLLVSLWCLIILTSSIHLLNITHWEI